MPYFVESLEMRIHPSRQAHHQTVRRNKKKWHIIVIPPASREIRTHSLACDTWHVWSIDTTQAIACTRWVEAAVEMYFLPSYSAADIPKTKRDICIWLLSPMMMAMMVIIRDYMWCCPQSGRTTFHGIWNESFSVFFFHMCAWLLMCWY